MDLQELVNKLTLEVKLTDKRAIEIVNGFPEDKRDQIIEKYIILGDMVVSHASISTSKESVERFFSPLRADIETIREQLKRIVPTIATPAKKGDITVKAIYDSFLEHFMDDSFEDVSKIGKYADIMATTFDDSKVLIELKDYKNDVPYTEVDKFWRDMEVRNVEYGIFISMRTRISKFSTCINLRRKMNKTGVFIINSELNWKGHLFAFHVIKKVIEIENLKKREMASEDAASEDISISLGKIYNIINEISQLSKNIDEINKIVDDLRTLSGRRYDKIISIVNIYKIKINEKIDLALDEFKKVET